MDEARRTGSGTFCGVGLIPVMPPAGKETQDVVLGEGDVPAAPGPGRDPRRHRAP
ncbi:hypothetical protein GCM10010266_62890 [Streptomyces griseomycini]|nr:hypothetical protein GCM10010266_62890 [Streptomyces griseomycini]